MTKFDEDFFIVKMTARLEIGSVKHSSDEVT